MKDIFELLQHENHEIELIKHGNQFILGCKTCGKTLLDSDYVKANTNEYVSILETLKQCNGKKELLFNIQRLGCKMLHIDDEDIKKMANMVHERLNRYKSIHTYFYVTDLVSTIHTQTRGITYAQTLTRACYTEEDWNTILKAIKLKILFEVKKDIKGYKFLHEDETIAAGCVMYSVPNNYYKPFGFIAMNEEMMKQDEKEFPTPTDIYTFKDIDDFYNKEPDYEDEEEDNYKYKEYIYRMKSNLYDFKNINENILIKNAIGYFADYDCVERYVTPLKKVLTEKYGIEL